MSYVYLSWTAILLDMSMWPSAEGIGTIIVTVAANWEVWSQVAAVPFVGGPEYMCLCGGSLKRGKHLHKQIH
jgi:hypothetical protein